MNISWKGRVKVIYLSFTFHWYIYDFHSTPSTNIHWKFNIRRFFARLVEVIEKGNSELYVHTEELMERNKIKYNDDLSHCDFFSGRS